MIMLKRLMNMLIEDNIKEINEYVDRRLYFMYELSYMQSFNPFTSS